MRKQKKIGLDNIYYGALFSGEVYSMLAGAVLMLLVGLCLLIVGIVILIRLGIKDKRVEDARQRQRERQNDEMWQKIRPLR